MNVREGIGTEAIHLPWVDQSFPSPPALFEQRLTQIIKPGDRVLDAGCGAGRFLSFRSARAQGCKVVGVDLCDDLRVNPSLDMRAQSDLNALPFADATFDAIVCRMVVEHLRQPKTAFAEFHRVLKPSGTLAIFTSNVLHYFGTVARATPLWFHRWFNTRIRGFSEQDTFETHYRANTNFSLRRQLNRAGFSVIHIELIEGAPSVLAFNSVLYRCGLAYARLVNRFDSLSSFRLNIIATAHKSP